MVNVVSFYSDLERGKKKEDIILRDIRAKYPKAHKIEGKEKRYDINVPEINIKVEVKYDEKSKETGNVFIEYWFNDGKSGIQTTIADYWVIIDEEKKMWIKVEHLKSIIDNPEIEKRSCRGEDGTEVCGYIIKKEEFISNKFVIIIPYGNNI